jgi:hypothetical protein
MADRNQQQQRIIRCNGSTVAAESGDLVIGDRNIITGKGFSVQGNENRIREYYTYEPVNEVHHTLTFAQLLANPVTHLTVQGNGNHITSNQVSVTGHENEIHGRNARVTGDRNGIVGSSPEVRGHNNHVIGRNANVTGNSNKVEESNPSVQGDSNRVVGRNANVTGNHNTVEGSNPDVRGHHNHVTGRNARVTGDRNTVDGSNATAQGDNNTVSGRYSSAMGRNNTVDGFPAEEADQRRRESREQRLQHLQAAQRNNQLGFAEAMELSTLVAQQRQDQTMQLFRQQLGQLNVQQAPAQLRQPLRPRQASPAPPQQQPVIQLSLRGEDEALTDENDTECLICRENKAVVLSICCAKLTSCIACARTLYEGKTVGQVRCMNCREEVQHVMRILH